MHNFCAFVQVEPPFCKALYLSTLKKCARAATCRRDQQTAMIKANMTDWLVDELHDSDCLTDNTLVYTTVLLLNLCSRTAGEVN